MTWLRFSAKADDDFASEQYPQVAEIAGIGLQFVEQLH